MYMNSAKSLLLLYFLLSLFLGGCGQFGGLQGQAPVVNISDPSVYTSLHLHAAKKHIEQHIKGTNKDANEPNDSFSVMDDMARYFRKTPKTYDKYHLRMDDMLDDSQRISDALHVYESIMRLALQYSPLGLQGTGEPLSADLIPSSLFSGSKETQEKLKAAEKAQKVVKEKEAELKKAKDDLAKAKKSCEKDAEKEITQLEKKVDKLECELSKAKKEAEDKQKAASKAVAEEAKHPLAALRPKLVGLVSDSPFDRIDRARDFYTAYMLKILRSLGDSRAIDPCLLKIETDDSKINDCLCKLKAGKKCDQSDSKLQNLQRPLLVTFQVHVEPGTRPNYMVGLRMTVKKIRKKDHSEGDPNDVKIIQLHPTRAYDIENQLLLERINTAFGLSLSGSITGTKDEMKFLWEERRKSEARRNFLSRISKIASFADAGRNEFGWNFYPSNIMVERKGLFQSFSHWQKSGPSGDYVVNAYLEGGARDCCAYILVPYDFNEIDLGIEYVIKSVAHGELNLPEKRYHIDKKKMRREISWLRKPSFIEGVTKFFSIPFTSQHDRCQIVPACGGCSGYSCVTLKLPEWHLHEAAAAWPVLSTSLKR